MYYKLLFMKMYDNFDISALLYTIIFICVTFQNHNLNIIKLYVRNV